MKSVENCGVCGKPLVYGTEEISMRCAFCGNEFSTLIYCPDGHFVCDFCHGRETLDILRDVLNSTDSTDPVEMLETVMSHPSVPMHGPEHHAIVPAVIVAAVKNVSYPVPRRCCWESDRERLKSARRLVRFSRGLWRCDRCRYCGKCHHRGDTADRKGARTG